MRLEMCTLFAVSSRLDEQKGLSCTLFAVCSRLDEQFGRNSCIVVNRWFFKINILIFKAEEGSNSSKVLG